MSQWIAQSSEFEVWQQAVKNQFQKGGSITVAFMVLLAIIVAVLVVGWISRLQGRLRDTSNVVVGNSNPQRLYTHLLCNLGLTVPQRQFLEKVARDLEIPHPASLLISSVLFDQTVERWMGAPKSQAAGERASAVQLAAKARSRLFPEGAGMVFTTGAPSQGAPSRS